MRKPPANVFKAPVDDDEAESGVAKPAPPKAQPARSNPEVVPRYRVGKKNLGAYVPAQAANQFKAMAAEEGKTVQEAFEDMLNREFARKNRPQIAK